MIFTTTDFIRHLSELVKSYNTEKYTFVDTSLSTNVLKFPSLLFTLKQTVVELHETNPTTRIVFDLEIIRPATVFVDVAAFQDRLSGSDKSPYQTDEVFISRLLHRLKTMSINSCHKVRVLNTGLLQGVREVKVGNGGQIALNGCYILSVEGITITIANGNENTSIYFNG